MIKEASCETGEDFMVWNVTPAGVSGVPCSCRHVLGIDRKLDS